MISTVQYKIIEERMEHLNLPHLSYRRMTDVTEMYKYTHDMYQVQRKPFMVDRDMS